MATQTSTQERDIRGEQMSIKRDKKAVQNRNARAAAASRKNHDGDTTTTESFIQVMIAEKAEKSARRREALPRVGNLSVQESNRFHQAKKAKEHKLVAELARNEFATRLLNRVLVEFVTVKPTQDDKNRTAAALRVAKEKLGMKPNSTCKAAEDTIRVILPWAYEELHKEHQLQDA